MQRFLDILTYPIRKEPWLFLFTSLLHLFIVILGSVNDLDVDPASVAIHPIFDSYLLCILACLLRKIKLAPIVAILYGAWVTAELFCVFFYGSLINAHVTKLILRTHSHETKEFAGAALTHPATWECLGLLLLAIGGAYILTWALKKLPKVWKNVLGSILMLTMLTSGIVETRTFIRCYRCFHAPDSAVLGSTYYRPSLNSPIVRTLFSIAFIYTEQKEIQTLSEAIQRPTVTSTNIECPTILLIIGESFNKHHCGLYSEEYKTANPRLCQLAEQGNIAVFDDVVTTSNMTSHVMKHLFTTWNNEDTDSWMNHTLFPVAFREAGYKVWMLSNQYSDQSHDMWSTIGGTLFTSPALQKAQFDWYSDSVCTYDEQALALLPPMEELTAQPSLIIFHLRGQHVDYNKRYPAEWEIFQPEDMHPAFGGKKGQRISAQYNNATLYNDYVVDSIWRMFKDQDAIAIYFSDHGEEVYDWRNFFERSDENKINREIARYQFEVPMMVMMSDRYMQLHDSTTQLIRQAIHRPFINSDMDQMLLHLGGIGSTEYDPTRDILSDQYLPRDRYIGGGCNYDSLMAEENE